MSSWNRRDFVTTSARAGMLAGLGNFAFLNNLPPVSADEVRPAREMVRFSPDMEPLVRLLEDTPRERVLEAVAGRIRGRTSYQELLSAVMLAGVRGIQPRPVGFKFHAVLVINSAHLASLAASDRDRWLPLFWSIDNYKNSQARNAREGNWVMPPVNEGQLPTAAQARATFIRAMDNWDETGADRAVASLVRTAGTGDVMELFVRYGARDFRDIGHKAIYVANSWRTLQTIGWRHAEPILRSLAYALLEHEGTNPAQRDADADRPWRENIPRAGRVRAAWQRGRASRDATTEMLSTMRTATTGDASERVVTLLNREFDPASLWDGLFLFAGELLMRQPGIIGLHCVTMTNALYYGYQASGNDETRKMMLLQCAAFLTMFRNRIAGGRPLPENPRIDALERLAVEGRGPAAIEEIFADAGRDRMRAARKTIALLEADRSQAEALSAAARRLIFTKGTDSHDYKFSSAILEDFYHASPAWRARFLATGMFYLKGSGGADTDLLRRTRAALSAS